MGNFFCCPLSHLWFVLGAPFVCCLLVAPFAPAAVAAPAFLRRARPPLTPFLFHLFSVVSRPNSPARPTVSPPNSPSGGGGGLSRSESGAQMIVSPSNTEIASLLSSARKWKPNLQKAETGRARALLDLLVAQSTPGSAFRDQMQNGSVPAYRWIITHFGSERDPSMYLTPAVKAVGMKLSASGGSSKGSQSNSRMTSAMTTPAPTPGRAKNASKGGGEHLAD